MDDIVKYFKYALFFPIIMAFLVGIILLLVMVEGGYNVSYGGDLLVFSSECVWPTPRIYENLFIF